MLTPKELFLGRTPADSPASKQGHLEVLSLNHCLRQAGFHENVATFLGELNDQIQRYQAKVYRIDATISSLKTGPRLSARDA